MFRKLKIFVIIFLTAIFADCSNPFPGDGFFDLTLVSQLLNQSGITVKVSPPLITTEDSGTAQFTVLLKRKPATGTSVTIPISVSNPAEGSITTPASGILTFTDGDWNIEQPVIITGLNDAVADGDVSYTVDFGVITSTDTTFPTSSPSSINAVNLDNDYGIIITAVPVLNTTEAGGTATFTVVLSLSPAPGKNVILPISISDSTEGTITSPFSGTSGSITFTDANWDVPKTIKLKGLDDSIADGDISYTVDFGTIGGTDTNYPLLTPPASLNALNSDNESVGFNISATSLSFYEYSSPGTFTVSLNSDPGTSVTIPLSSGTAKANVSPASLNFTSGNWSLTQLVTVTPVNDSAFDADANSSVILGVVTGAGSSYVGQDPADVTLTVRNDDKRIFRTIGTAVASFTGNLGGVAGADAYCNTRAGDLGIGTSKAILAASTRTACTTSNCSGGPSEHNNWVLLPEFSYYRPDGTFIMKTNSNAIFPFIVPPVTVNYLTNKWDGSAWGENGFANPGYWTGLKYDWTSDSNNCQNWTSSLNSNSGNYGDDNFKDSQSIDSAGLTCDLSDKDLYILCAEQ